MPGKEHMYYKKSLAVFVISSITLILAGLIVINLSSVWAIDIYLGIATGFIVLWLAFIRPNLAKFVRNTTELTEEKIERCIPTLCSEITPKIRKGKPAHGQVAYLADFCALALGNPNISVTFLQNVIQSQILGLGKDGVVSLRYVEKHSLEGVSSMVILWVGKYNKKVMINDTACLK